MNRTIVGLSLVALGLTACEAPPPAQPTPTSENTAQTGYAPDATEFKVLLKDGRRITCLYFLGGSVSCDWTMK